MVRPLVLDSAQRRRWASGGFMSRSRIAFFLAFVGLLMVTVTTGVQPQSPQSAPPRPAQPFRFHLQEATIDDIHRAIREGQISCRGLVQLYINRAKAYNGVADELVTRDGAPIAPPARRGSRGFATEISDQHGCRIDAASEFRSVRGTADRVRPDGSRPLRSQRTAAVRHDHRHPQRGPS